MNLGDIKELPIAVVILAIIVGPIASGLVGFFAAWWQFKRNQSVDKTDNEVKISDAALRIVKELQADAELRKKELVSLKEEVAYMRELKDRIRQLEDENKILKAENSQLKAELEEIKNGDEKVT